MNSQFLTTFALMKAGNKMKVIMQRSDFVLFNLILLLFAFMGIHGCTGISDTANAEQIVVGSVLKANGDTIELKRGDILVRPNLNLLPGSSFVANGKNFGHAALVVKGYKHTNVDTLLAGAVIVESIAKDVPAAFQVREINAMVSSRMEAFDNHNFGNSYVSNRYRLRLQLSKTQVDSIVDFALSQKGKLSSWNASKYFPVAPEQQTVAGSLMKNETWYCSLLVWQSFLNVTGIDLDPNGGYMVYPNDLINSPYFDQLPEGEGRIRF